MNTNRICYCGVSFSSVELFVDHLTRNPTHVTSASAIEFQEELREPAPRSETVLSFCRSCECNVVNRAEHTSKHTQGKRYCLLCSLWMKQGNQQRHERGRQHTSKKLLQLQLSNGGAGTLNENDRRRLEQDIAELHRRLSLLDAAVDGESNFNAQRDAAASGNDDHNDFFDFAWRCRSRLSFNRVAPDQERRTSRTRKKSRAQTRGRKHTFRH